MDDKNRRKEQRLFINFVISNKEYFSVLVLPREDWTFQRLTELFNMIHLEIPRNIFIELAGHVVVIHKRMEKHSFFFFPKKWAIFDF
jgi:hypothetical protein